MGTTAVVWKVGKPNFTNKEEGISCLHGEAAVTDIFLLVRNQYYPMRTTPGAWENHEEFQEPFPN